MNNIVRNLLIVLFTTGLLVGFAMLTVDSLMARNSAALESTSQNNLQVQADAQSINDQIVAKEESSTAANVFAMASKMGVLPLIIILVFGVQMGLVWLFRKPAQAVRW